MLGFDVPRPEDWPGGISGIVTVAGYVTTSDDPWWMGPIGWVVEDLVQIEPPLPCRGAQRLWRAPAELARLSSK